MSESVTICPRCTTRDMCEAEDCRWGWAVETGYAVEIEDAEAKGFGTIDSISVPAPVPAILSGPPAPISRDVIKQIALDIGKEVASHVETMYPKAVEATSKTMLLLVRNCVYNEIMAALGEVDEEAILRRLEDRKQFRRQHRAAYRKFRKQPVTDDVMRDE